MTNNQKKQLKKMVKSGHTVDDVYNYAVERGIELHVVTQEELRNYICDMIKGDTHVAHVLTALEDDTMADYFNMDLSNSMYTPTPIYTAEEMVEVMSL